MLLTSQERRRSPGIQPPSYRKPRSGPELELVQEFIEYALPEAQESHARTLFIEPCIESGFPDAVVVYHDTSTAAKWNASRRLLTTDDFRLAQCLSCIGETSEVDLAPFFGAKLRESLERLLAANLATYRNGNWKLSPLTHAYAARRIIAIEAKIRDWREGLEQAVTNTWFTCESYLLMPRIPKRSEVLETARGLNVKVLTHGQHLHNRFPKTQRTPRSYVSWLFNDWAWRQHQGDYPPNGS